MYYMFEMESMFFKWIFLHQILANANEDQENNLFDILLRSSIRICTCMFILPTHKPKKLVIQHGQEKLI